MAFMAAALHSCAVDAAFLSVDPFFQADEFFLVCNAPLDTCPVICVADSAGGSRLAVAANAIVRFAHLVLSVGSYIKAKVRRVFTYLREGYCRPHFHGSRKRVCFFRL
jgi:hypothetical protein